ncbi:hypothetical protein GGR56DRAFT_661285 [Xylariaceae sp. FL0804]|nr:hypothetical protein GGR56DRAFT_661285 [Xylariaceae sp. FL0804]
MVWTQTESVVWTDEFDGAEKTFYSMSQAFKGCGQEHGSVYSICKISALHHDPTTLHFALRNAWRRLRFDFPALTVFEQNKTKIYAGATPDCVEQWVEETFSISDATSATSVVPYLHLRRLPLLVFVPQTSEVIFHCSHWRVDALGACMVLDRFFDLLANIITSGGLEDPPWNEEYKNLSSSLEDAYGSPRATTPTIAAEAEAICQRNFVAAYPSVGLPYQGGPTAMPGLSRSQTMRLSLAQSEALIAACKARNISVTAAAHAACAAAVFERAEDRNCESYSTVVSANLRGLLPARQLQQITQPLSNPISAYTCGTYVTGITHTVRRDESFLTKSRRLTADYRGSWDTTRYMPALRLIYRVHGEALTRLATSAARGPASNVTVSSLGVIDGKYLRSDHGPVQVETFHLGSAIMTRQPTLYIWTFQGRLSLSIDYNETYYRVGMISGLIECIVLHLSNGLGTEL